LGDSIGSDRAICRWKKKKAAGEKQLNQGHSRVEMAKKTVKNGHDRKKRGWGGIKEGYAEKHEHEPLKKREKEKE